MGELAIPLVALCFLANLFLTALNAEAGNTKLAFAGLVLTTANAAWLAYLIIEAAS